MKKGIISYGEAFIDYISKNQSNTDYNKYLGGTTINAAVGVRRLGSPAYYLCEFGVDEDSEFIMESLQTEKVNVTHSIQDPNKNICTVYVHINEKGERFFHSYENKTPDVHLLPDEIKTELFQQAAILYCGSGTLFHPFSRQTTEKAIQLAKEQNTLVAFDANIRLKRWKNENECRTTIIGVLPSVDLLKLSDEELLFLMETNSLDAALEKLSAYSIPNVWITLGENGSIVIHENVKIQVDTMEVDVVDTTGAGDAFMAGILHQVHEKGLPNTIESLEEYTVFANKLGAMTCTNQGALTAFTEQP